MSELRFAVLGPVRAWRGDTELDLGSPQARAVLAVLLLAEGRQVSLHALVDALWGDEPPKTAVGTVRTYVSRLRRELGTGTAGSAHEMIESLGDGYALPLRSATLDLNLFKRWAEEARAARSAGEAGQAAVFLRDALGLWQGMPLAGIPGEYAESQRVRLTELQMAAVEERLALDVELGGHVAATTELQTLLAAHPLRERLSELLMLALYRSGRQADALAVFDSTRRLLAEELGVDPGPALRQMHQRILQMDEDLIGAAAPHHQAASPDISPPTQRVRSVDPRPLPVSTTSLLGRERAIDEVTRLVEPPGMRLVTLTGPGGIGKTRLAVAVGERLRDRFGAGTAFIPLAAVTDPGLVLDAIGRAVGADVSGMGSPLDALAEQFGDDPWLLILDNLEQVVHAAGHLNELLARCRGVVIVATSRTVLGLRAEQEYGVPSLPLPADPADGQVSELAASPAVALFVDRACAVRHDFALTEHNAAAVAELCRLVEGLPLAIELAAARTRLLEPGALLDRIAASFDALGTGAVDMPERQHTLRATVDWSIGLLDDAERSLLEVTAVFADGWTIEAAAQVAGLNQDRALALTEVLARHSLVQLDRTELGLRSRMLETVRAFVAERLAARADAAGIQRRHASYYRALAEQADRPLRGVGWNQWAERLQAEAGNLAAAVRWCLTHDPESLPHLFRSLLPLWALADDILGEARSWVDQLLPAADSLDPQARAELVWTAAVTVREVGDDAAALAARQRLGPLLEGIHDPYLHAVAGLAMAWTSAVLGDYDRAARETSVSLERFRSQDELFWTAMALVTLGSLERGLGRYDDARRHLTEMRDLAERLDNARFTSASTVQLGILAIERGQPTEARALLGEALDLSRATHSTRNVTLCLAAFAQLAFGEGDAQQAALLMGAAEGLRRRAGIRAWPTVQRGEPEPVAQICQALGANRFDEIFTAGIRLSQREAVAAVRDRRGTSTRFTARTGEFPRHIASSGVST